MIEQGALDVGPNGPLDRDGVVEAVGRMRIEGFAISEMRIRKFGDVEVVTYRARVDGTYENRPFPYAETFATTVWRRSDGRWRVAHRHESPARPAGA